MKRFLLSLGVAALASASVPLMAQEAETPAYVCKFGTGFNSKMVSAYECEWEVNVDNHNWKVVNCNNNNNGWTYVKVGNKSKALTGTITNTFEMVGVYKVEVELGAVTTASVNSVALKASNNSDMSDAATISTTVALASNAKLVYEMSAGSYKYFQFVADCKQASSNGPLAINKLNYYSQANVPTLEDAGISFSETEFTANLGETFTAPVLVNPNNLEGITYTSSKTDIATVDATTGAVTLVGRGLTTITAAFAGNDTYRPGTAHYTLNVVDPNAMDVTFDFINNDYGLTRSSTSYTVTGTLTESPVTIDLSKEDGSGFRLWTDGLRVYKGTTYMSFAVPAGLMITDVNFECDAPSSTQIHKETSTGNYATDAATSYTGINNQIIKFKIVATDNKAIKTILVKYAKATEVEKKQVDGLFANYLNNGTTVYLPTISSEELYSEGVVECYIPEKAIGISLVLGSQEFWVPFGSIANSVVWNLESQSHEGVITDFDKDGMGAEDPIECGFNTGVPGVGHLTVTIPQNDSVLELTNRKVDVVVYPHTSVHFPYTEEDLNGAVQGNVLTLPKHDETNDGSYKYHYMLGGAAAEPEAAPRRVVSHEGYTEYNHEEGITLPQSTNTVSLVAEKNGVMSPEPATFQVKVSGPTGVNVISADSEAEYFDLSGRKLQGEPEKGLYIVRTGNKTRKVVL